MSEDLVARLSEDYMVSPDVASAYVNHAQAVQNAHGFENESVDDALREAEITHNLADATAEKRMQEILKDRSGKYSETPLIDAQTKPLPSPSRNAEPLDVIEPVTFEYDLGVFHGYDTQSHLADVNPALEEVGELEERNYEILVDIAAKEGVGRQTGEVYADILQKESVSDSDLISHVWGVVNTVLNGGLFASMHHIQGVPTRDMSSETNEALTSYLVEQGEDLLAFYDEPTNLDNMTTEERGESAIALKNRRVIRGVESQVSKEFTKQLLNPRNVYDVQKTLKQGSRAYEKSRERMVLNAVHRFDNADEAHKWHEKRMHQTEELRHLPSVEEDYEFHRSVMDSFDGRGDVVDERNPVPYKP